MSVHLQVVVALDVTPFMAGVCNVFSPFSGKNHGFQVATSASLGCNGTLVALHLAAKRNATSVPLENIGMENAMECHGFLLSVNIPSPDW